MGEDRIPLPAGQPVDPGAARDAESSGSEEDRAARTARLGVRGTARPKRRKGAVTICTARCRSSLRAVRLALAELGWAESEVEAEVSAVIWREHGDATADLCSSVVTSKLGGYLRLCKKVRFAEALRAAKRVGGEPVSPRTWLLPEEADAVRALKRKRPLIAKPAGSSQGRGIVVATQVGHLQDVLQRAHERDQWVVQEYLAPALLDGCKFDLRLYVVVVGFGDATSFKAFLFEDGLARVCSVPYKAPRAANRECREMHLTNFAVQRDAVGFAPAGADGSKRPARAVLEALGAEHGLASGELWARCRRACAEVAAALQGPVIEASLAPADATWAGNPGAFPTRGFQLLGVDLLFDAGLRPWVLEVNANPSLSLLEPADEGKLISDLDEALKTRLLGQALRAARPLSDAAARRAQAAWESGSAEAPLLGPAGAEGLDWLGPEDTPGLASWLEASATTARLFARFASQRLDLSRSGFARLAAAAGLLGPGGGAGTAFASKVDADVWWSAVARSGPVDFAAFLRALADRAAVLAPGAAPGDALEALLASAEALGE